MKKYNLSDFPGLADIEAERGEVAVTPDGGMFSIGGKPHSRGGTPMVAPSGTRIFSRHMKLDEELVEAAGLGSGSKSPAQLVKKFDNTRDLYVLGHPKDKRYDDLSRRTAEINLAIKGSAVDTIFGMQEMAKTPRGKKRVFQAGGTYVPEPFHFRIRPADGKNLVNGWIEDDPNWEDKYRRAVNDYRKNPASYKPPAWALGDSGMTPQEYAIQMNGIKYGEAMDKIPNGGIETMQAPPLPSALGQREQERASLPTTVNGLSTNAPTSSGTFLGRNPYSSNKPPVSVSRLDFSRQDAQKPLNLQADLNYSNYDTKQGLFRTVVAPFSGSEYFRRQEEILNSRPLSADQARVLRQRQEEISTLASKYGPNDGVILERAYAKYLKEADQIEKDQFLSKTVVLADGTEKPLADATEQEIDSARSFKYHNSRTGRNDLVDLRDRQNQGGNPILVYESIDRDQYIPSVPPKDMIPLGLKPPTLPKTPTPVVPPTDKLPVKDAAAVQGALNGVQLALLAADFANVRVKPPYYDYRPNDVAYTRTVPINTKAAERATNVAVESLMASNIPDSLKMSYVAQLQGQQIEGTNQVAITNTQNRLANDNANVERYLTYSRDNNLREQDANMRYVQEADRRNYLAAAQRQEYLSNALGIWRESVNNRRNLGLVNQISPNYDYDPRTNRVIYQPGTTPVAPIKFPF